MSKLCCKHGTLFNQVPSTGIYSKPCKCCNSKYPYDNDDKSGYCPGCRGDIKTQKEINRQRESITRKLKKLNSNLNDLQQKCAHPRATKKGNSDTGNWCKSDDCYWYDFSCPDCGLKWSEDQ